VITLILFFFSSRRRHTISKRDGSSDVCSSDLEGTIAGAGLDVFEVEPLPGDGALLQRCDQGLLVDDAAAGDVDQRGRVLHQAQRSEERRVGKSWRSR